VRKLLGYGRFDTQAAVDAINDLYRNELRLFQNLFQPSVRLKEKVRVGSKLRRKYDEPRTPLERVIDSRGGNPAKIAQLKALLERLDPFALSAIIERKLGRIWGMRSKAPKPAWLQKGAVEQYWDKPSEGNILKPKLPGIELYEKVLRRETALQTW